MTNLLTYEDSLDGVIRVMIPHDRHPARLHRQGRGPILEIEGLRRWVPPELEGYAALFEATGGLPEAAAGGG